MKVKELMVREVRGVAADDSLGEAARIMWEHDCGCVPVVDQELHVVGMLTDRDICMAAYTQGVSLGQGRVASAMSRRLYWCEPEDSVREAAKIMREVKVRRLPVIDPEGHLVGILSLNDIARKAARERTGRAAREVSESELGALVASICEPRHPKRVLARAA
ncbi:MAG TPA: CBS domain-containing protein [Candidatus Binataceae bacterium]|jgi:CBS domain-containing protein|nr:CBS domain-containing protein [Candidatus Binataceae bacterium]